jgi:hypothetical protein
MTTTMTYIEELTVTHCWCGIALAIPENLYRHAHRRGDSVYCPLGHAFSWGDTVERQLKRERAEHQATRDLLRAEERSHSATRGQLTKARKRAAAGVCPCCKRSFANVARHVAHMHPDFNPEAKPDADADH